MARRTKEEQFSARRKEILDVAFELISTKGYEQMTIQDILDRLQISKGAFYHYFDSKGAVLEAVTDQMVEEFTPRLEAIVRNPQLSALDKLQQYFNTANRWKIGQKDIMIALLRVWYSEENSIVRLKIMNRSVEKITPLLTELFRQGAAEGVVTSPYIEDLCDVMINLLAGLGDSFSRLLFKENRFQGDLDRLQSTVDAYTDALERVLGCPEGSLTLIDDATIKEWFEFFQTAREDTPKDDPGDLAS